MVGLLSCRYRSLKFCWFVACAVLQFTARVESFTFSAPPPVTRKIICQQQRVRDACPATTKVCHLNVNARTLQSMRLHASPSPNNGDNNDGNPDDSASQPGPTSGHDYSTEEILLCLHLEVLAESGIPTPEALAQVQAYSQSFPFAAVLPVQPLMCESTAHAR
jgi:hypothetical protein